MYIKQNYCEGGYHGRKYGKRRAVKTSIPETLWSCQSKEHGRQCQVDGWVCADCLPALHLSLAWRSRARQAVSPSGLWDSLWHVGALPGAAGQPVTQGNTVHTCRPGTGRLGITQGNSALAFRTLQPLKRIKWSAKQNSTSTPATWLQISPGWLLVSSFFYLILKAEWWKMCQLLGSGKLQSLASYSKVLSSNSILGVYP